MTQTSQIARSIAAGRQRQPAGNSQPASWGKGSGSALLPFHLLSFLIGLLKFFLDISLFQWGLETFFLTNTSFNIYGHRCRPPQPRGGGRRESAHLLKVELILLRVNITGKPRRPSSQSSQRVIRGRTFQRKSIPQGTCWTQNEKQTKHCST